MNIKEIIQRQKDINEIRLQESGNPYVGVFYIIDDSVEFMGDHTRLVQTVNGVKDYDKLNHWDQWYKILVKHHSVAKKLFDRFDAKQIDKRKWISWEYLPRGRVICDDKGLNFKVVCDKHIANNEQLKAKVRNEMNLPYNTVFEKDEAGWEHYVCHLCDPSIFGE
jgi:hypothetical protein